MIFESKGVEVIGDMIGWVIGDFILLGVMKFVMFDVIFIGGVCNLIS